MAKKIDGARHRRKKIKEKHKKCRENVEKKNFLRPLL